MWEFYGSEGELRKAEARAESKMPKKIRQFRDFLNEELTRNKINARVVFLRLDKTTGNASWNYHESIQSDGVRAANKIIIPLLNEWIIGNKS